MAKKVIRVALVDCGEPAHVARGILRVIDDLYEVEFTSATDADYVFHSCMGYDVLRYSGVRIFVTGEMVSPNFNISDYALSFDPISLGDRHLWFPLIKLYGAAYQSLSRPRTPVADVLAQKTGFCAYVMSNIKKDRTLVSRCHRAAPAARCPCARFPAKYLRSTLRRNLPPQPRPLRAEARQTTRPHVAQAAASCHRPVSQQAAGEAIGVVGCLAA